MPTKAEIALMKMVPIMETLLSFVPDCHTMQALYADAEVAIQEARAALNQKPTNEPTKQTAE